MDQGVAILISAVIAVTSLFITGTFNRRLMRKQHTYQVLEKLNPSERFDEAVSKAAKLISDGRMPRLDCREDEAECDNLDFILNHYEFISAAIVCGDVDEKLVRRVEDGRMRRTYLKFLPYIEDNRELRSDIKMWENLEFLIHRWELQESDQFTNFVDRLIGRPPLANFHNERAEIATSLRDLAARIK
ncbi:DUF4760 domain-containing protein [Altererythrobacter sp. Z27]|uniref:DUF4760 domain-containing protein n=1 Tax=Altererythrobacter sp. Z27 TaxID=3461147 RepID=UPI004043E3C0